MAKYSNTVEYNIRTTLDNSGLTKLTTQIRQVEASLKMIQSQPLLRTSSIDSAIAKLGQVQKVLQSSFDPKLGMMNSQALITGLNSIEGGMKGVYQAFSQGGTQGIKAFNSLYGQVSKVDTGLRQMSSTTDKIMNTLGNTVRWGLIASAFASVMNAAHQSAEYVKDLDRSLTNIMMVSGETRDNMNEFARSANEVAQRLGGTTVQMTEATKVFIQQGYKLGEASQLGEYAVHLANVSEQDSTMASDEITAYMNAFKIPLDDMGNAISKWAAVANNAAVSVEELSVASQKAASVAATVGVDLDQFAGHIAAIESVTREAPENIGNGLKTIYSRIADISLGETLEDGVNLGSFAKALEKVNVDVLDNTGKLRDAGIILEDLMKVWQDLDTTQRAAVAKTVAGRFQLARFEALMNRADIYENAANISRAETGTATYDRMQETYRESLEGKSKALTATIEEIFLNAFETDSFYALIDAVTGVTKAFAELMKAIGGGGSAISAFSAVLLKTFSQNIGAGIGNFITNRQTQAMAASNREAVASQATAMLARSGATLGNASTNAAIQDISKMNQYRGQMTAEQEQRVNQVIDERIALINQELDLEKQLEATRAAASAVSEHSTGKQIQSTEQLLSYLGQLKLETAEISAQDLIHVGYGKMAGEAEKAQQAIASLRLSIDEIIEAEKREDTSLQASTAAWEKFMATGKQNVNILRGASQALSLTESQSEKLSTTLRILETALNGDTIDVEKLRNQLDSSNIELREFAENIELAYSGLRVMKDQAEGNVNALIGVRQAIEANSGMAAGIASGQATQQKATDITRMIGDIGQLAFAWQSFQHLGSLWADDDIETGEKILQTVINISFALPMLINGLQGLATGWKVVTAAIKDFSLVENLSNIATSLRIKLLGEETVATSANLAARRAAAATELAEIGSKKALNTISLITVALKNKLTLADTANIAAKMGLISAEIAETIATKGLAVALGELLIAALPLAAPFLAVAAAIAAIAIPIGIAMKEAEEARKQFEENLNASNEIVDTINSQKDSYDELYKKYEETGEVSDELKEKAVSLGDALGVQGAQVLADAGNFDELNKKIQEATVLQLQYNEALLSQKRAELSGSIKSDRRQGEFTTDEYGNTYIDYSKDTRSNAQILGANQNQFNEYQKQIQQAQIELIQARAEGRDTSEIDQRIKRYQEEAKAIQLTAEELEYLNTLKQENDSDFAAKLESGAFDGLNFRDETGKADLSQYQDFLLQDKDIKEYYDYLFETAGKETADAYINSLISQISDRLPLDLQEALKEALDAANNATKEKSSYQSSVLSRQEQIQEDAGIESPEAFDQYQQQFIAVGGAGISQDEINTIKEYHDQTLNSIDSQKELIKNLEKEKDSLRDANGKIDESSDAYKDWRKRIREANDDLSKLAKDEKDQKEILDGLTLAAMETNTGLQELSEGWDKWNEALTSGDLNEQSVALTELQSSMEKVLNIDPGTLPTEFVKDHLEEISALAQGDLSVLDNLRIAASETIVQEVVLKDENFKGDVDELTNYVHQAQELLPELEIGATVDDAEFIAGLENMLQNAQITEQDLGAIFEAMGYDVQIDYETASLPSFEWNAVSTGNSIMDAVLNGAGGLIGKVTGAIAGSIPIQVPRINFTKKGGGSSPALGSRGGGGGKSGGGGGGGGSSKANEPKSVSKSADISKSEPAAAENDIYEKVNATLEELKDSYSKLNKVKDRTWGKEYRDNAQKGLDLLVKEQKTLSKRIDIAKKYADALKTGKSNLDYGIDMTDKESLASLGLSDSNLDGVIDNYISRFEEVRQAARKLDAEAEAYRNKANAEALAYWQSKGGRLDNEGNVITEASMSEDESEYYSKLVEKQNNHYNKLVEKANEQWELAEKINDVTKDYEDTMNQIRDDEEEQLDLAHEIEDIQIDLYQRSLDMLDTMHDINDIAAQMKGFFTKLATDDPFRALTESAQAFENSFKDATYNASAYYDDIIEKLMKEQQYVQANSEDWKKYNEAIAWYNQQKAKAVTNADGLGSGELAQQSRKLTELERWIQNPNAVDNPYGTNTQALYDAYREQYQKVTDAALEAEERMESVHESILEAYDKMAERQDELVQQYDRVDEQLNRTADRVSLFKGEDAYADQAVIAKQRAKVALAAGRSNLKILAQYQKQLDKAQEEQEAARADKVASAQKEVNRLQKALNADKNNLDLQQQLANAKVVLERAKYDDSEEIKALKSQIDEMTDYINEQADKAAEHFKDAYESTIDEIAAQTNKKIFGNRDLDLITNDWDWDKDYFSSYKDNVERTLETEKLRLKYLDLLDSAQGMSLGVQRQIKDAMDEQLALLENQKTVSEYDVKLANARLEILQKQIALENAQQNKNQMKLRRDTQGNYKYVYAADQDNVRDKQRELLESEFDAYEMSKDANADAYQKGIALYQQYIEQRTAIEKKYANDVDTMEKELAKLRENYLRAAEANAEDLQNTYDGMIISVQWMAENGTEAVKNMTVDVLKALEEKTQESLEAVGIPWNEALAKGISDLGNLQQVVDETAQAGINAAEEFVEAIDGDAQDINDSLGSVKSMINDLARTIDGDSANIQDSFGDIKASIDNAKEAVIDLRYETDHLNQILGAELGAVDKAKARIREYEDQLNSAKESTSALANQLEATRQSLVAKTKEAEKWKTTYENYKKSVQEEKEEAKRKQEEAKKAAEEQKKSNSNNNNGGYSDSDIAWGIAQNIWTYGSWGNDPDRHARISERYGEAIANLTQQYINEYWATGDLVNWDSDKWGYATGGYTGTWGQELGLDGKNGKLAFLHQKELVLNQQDTENILEAVQVMRSIMDITKMASLSSSGFDARRISQTAADTIEQRVEITAEFPAANSADDIRQALLGLSDAAMQYAYRER